MNSKLNFFFLLYFFFKNSLAFNDPTVSTTVVDGVIRNVVFVEKTELAFLSTTTGTLYKSTNGGESWSDVSDVFSDFSSGVRFIQQNENNPSQIIFFGLNGDIWTTDDGGQNFDLMGTPTQFRNIEFHPRRENWLLGQKWAGSCSVYGAVNCNLELYVSMDFGATWTLINTYVEKVEWGGPNDQDTVYVATVFPAKTKYQYFIALEDAHLVKGAIGQFEATDILVPNTLDFFQSDTFLFALSQEPGSTGLALYVGKDGNAPKKARFPISISYSSEITVFDLTTDAIFLFVNNVAGASSATLYVSDIEGTDFVATLNNVRRKATHNYDIFMVDGLSGIFYANVFIDQNEINFATKQTFDNGGQWSYILPPSNSACSGDCVLNLDINSYFTAPVSTEKSVGTIVASGNVGESLVSQKSQMSTFISRDAGLTWTELFEGVYNPTIGYHGSIIMFVPDEATNSFLFSAEYGLNAQDFNFTDQLTTIQTVMTEPDLATQHYTIYGRHTDDLDNVVYHINFETINITVCVGHDQPDTPQSDYETWSPASTQDDVVSCLLGQKTTYIRKKETSNCLDNVLDVADRISTEICECTEQDFECSFGFEFSEQTGNCEFFFDNTPDGCVGPETYDKTNGLRKVAGSLCEGGINPVEIVTEVCSSEATIITETFISGDQVLTRTAVAGQGLFDLCSAKNCEDCLETEENNCGWCPDSNSCTYVTEDACSGVTKQCDSNGVLITVIVIIIVVLFILVFIVAVLLYKWRSATTVKGNEGKESMLAATPEKETSDEEDDSSESS